MVNDYNYISEELSVCTVTCVNCTLSKCNDAIKAEPFKSYCISLYCSYLWIDYKHSTFSKCNTHFLSNFSMDF